MRPGAGPQRLSLLAGGPERCGCCRLAQTVVYLDNLRQDRLAAGLYNGFSAFYPGFLVNSSGVTTTWQASSSFPSLPLQAFQVLPVGAFPQ